MAVVSESYYPFWRATVDGRAARLFRIDYGLMGVALAPGEHDVELVYERPSLYTIAAATSLATLLGIIAYALFATRRART
jgi:uncharacterized membrane protein YfhO